VSASLTRAAPVRFLLGVGMLWTVGRGLALAGWRPSEEPDHDVSRLSHRPPSERSTSAFVTEPGAGRGDSFVLPPIDRHPMPPPRLFAGDGPRPTPSLHLVTVASPEFLTYRHADGRAEAAAILPNRAAVKSRWSGSAWAFVRGGGRASALSPGGQIGGGQAGTRLLYRLDPAGRLAAAIRLSGTIGGARQTEAAVGLDWKPLSSLPLHLMVERRIAIDRGGRNAWTAGIAGGVDAVPIAPGWRLDGYAEAGAVGLKSRDLYADGAARVARAIGMGRGWSLALGGGLWGAAQPGAARLDVGPSAVLRLPVAHHTVALALDWRERIVGAAKPGSGIALTLASDF